MAPMPGGFFTAVVFPDIFFSHFSSYDAPRAQGGAIEIRSCLVW
jgi:hypothetical protein